MCLLHSIKNETEYKICTYLLIVPGFQGFPSDGSSLTDEDHFMNDRKEIRYTFIAS